MLYTDYYNLFLGTVMNQNVQPILSQENIYNGKPRMVPLTIVKNTYCKEDTNPGSLVKGDANKAIAAYLTADNILDQVIMGSQLNIQYLTEKYIYLYNIVGYTM